MSASVSELPNSFSFKRVTMGKGLGVLLLVLLVPLIMPLATVALLVVGPALLIRRVFRMAPYD